MSHPTDSQEQPRLKRNPPEGRLTGSLLNLALVRLRGDSDATFHSPQEVTYEQLGTGNSRFVDLDEAISLYPTPAEIPGYLLPSPEVLDKIKNTKGEGVRCPFCPSTFSGIVVKKSFKRHLQRHWNHGLAGKTMETDGQRSSLASSPAAQPVPDAVKPIDAYDHAFSDIGAQQSSHALPTSTSTCLVTLPDHAQALDPSMSPERPLTMAVHAASESPKSPTSKKGRKSLATSTLGTVCKDNTTLAIARSMEVLRSKVGMAFSNPDACPDLEHQSFTQGQGQFLDVDTTFSLYPTLDQLPESFWPTSHQYSAAALGEHRIRCLFCSWSFTGVYVKANFRGHVRHHWKLAAASQKANSPPSADVQLSPAIALTSYAPSSSFLSVRELMKNSPVLQHDIGSSNSKLDTAQLSSSAEIRYTGTDQIVTSDSVVTNPGAWRPHGRKRGHAETFSEEGMGRSEAAPTQSVENHAKRPNNSAPLGNARARSTNRVKPGTIFIPPEQGMLYEELVLVADRYFDIDKVVALYPLVEQVPAQFWPSLETFKRVKTKGGSERARCPFCTSSFKGAAAKRNMRVHVQRHWLKKCGVKTPEEIPNGTTESAHTSNAWSSLNRTPMLPPPSVPSMMQANINPERAQHTTTQIHMDVEMGNGNHATRPQANESRLLPTISGPIVQEVPWLVSLRVL